jgi:hypothetical protein
MEVYAQNATGCGEKRSAVACFDQRLFFLFFFFFKNKNINK